MFLLKTKKKPCFAARLNQQGACSHIIICLHSSERRVEGVKYESRHTFHVENVEKCSCFLSRIIRSILKVVKDFWRDERKMEGHL